MYPDTVDGAGFYGLHGSVWLWSRWAIASPYRRHKN
jgi:hypothetical protein